MVLFCDKKYTISNCQILMCNLCFVSTFAALTCGNLASLGWTNDSCGCEDNLRIKNHKTVYIYIFIQLWPNLMFCEVIGAGQIKSQNQIIRSNLAGSVLHKVVLAPKEKVFNN